MNISVSPDYSMNNLNSVLNSSNQSFSEINCNNSNATSLLKSELREVKASVRYFFLLKLNFKHEPIAEKFKY